MSGRHGGDSAIKREGIGDGAPEKKSDMSGSLGTCVDVLSSQQCFHLRRDADRPAIVRIVERFNAERIAGEKERAFPCVPDRERIHPAKIVDHLRAFLGVKMEQYFGVAVRGELATSCLERRTQRWIVVDLAIEGDAEIAIAAPHRLEAGVREIDNRQAAMGQPDATIFRDPKTLAIGTAIDHGIADRD